MEEIKRFAVAVVCSCFSRKGVPMAEEMANSPQSAAEVSPDASRCESRRKIADSLGGGEVRLYNLKKHPLPEVLNVPPEKELAECDWWLVHFPSRQCVAVPGGRLEGMRLLKKLEQGKDELGWVPLKAEKKVRACAPARASASATPGEEPKEGEGPEAKPKKKRVRLTKVPEGLGFDAAMKHSFPNARIVHEIEKLLAAEDEVVDREGNVLGSKPAWMVRKEAVKLMIDHAQGRPGEKPPPAPDKKKVTYDQLEKMLLESPAARMVFKGLIAKFDAADQAKAQPVEGAA